MDLSQQFLIDMALNVGGYLLAGVMGVVIYSLFNRRKPAAANIAEKRAEPVVETIGHVAVRENPVRKLEFIKLAGSSDAPSPGPHPVARQAVRGAAERRDRADIIRVARTMLKAGATPDKIKRVIPISDAELSLLGMSKS